MRMSAGNVASRFLNLIVSNSLPASHQGVCILMFSLGSEVSPCGAILSIRGAH